MGPGLRQDDEVIVFPPQHDRTNQLTKMDGRVFNPCLVSQTQLTAEFTKTVRRKFSNLVVEKLEFYPNQSAYQQAGKTTSRKCGSVVASSGCG